MNGRVHYWIVCDAVAYIKAHGDELQKRALQALELAYGERISTEEIPARKSAVERLAGFEAGHTDKFGDLTLLVPALPWETKRNVTGLCGHMFTAFNHFINPHPEATKLWSTGNGYSYSSSSMQGFDSFVIKGISDYLHGLVDEDHSLVLDRVRPAWTKGVPEWRDNFEHEIVNTTFAPWSVLVRFYYSYLLHKHNEPLEVRGPNSHIVGLQLLGPVFHAAADACSPQHVRPALGFGHQVWENYVQSRVYGREVDVSPRLILEIMSKAPFQPELTAKEGPLKGRFDVETFVYELSVKTAETLNKSTSTSWTELWQAGENFWRWYLTGKHMNDDARYLYNQAVAAAIYIVVRAYQDLKNLGILTPDQGLRDPSKLPTLVRIQDDGPDMPFKRLSEHDLPPEETRPTPLSHARDILGFDPSGETEVQSRLAEFTALFSRTASHARQKKDFKNLLGRLEKSLVQEYQLRAQRVDRAFCPLRAVEKIPIDSDISAHFGMGTFRLPSPAECNDSVLLADYMDQLDSHSEMAHRLELTQAISSLNFYMTRRELPESRSQRIDREIANLRRARDGTTLQNETRVLAKTIVESGGGILQKAVSVVQEFVAAFSRVPAMALATAVSVVLVVILVVPWGDKLPVMGLSGETWDESGYPVAKPKGLILMAPKVVPPAPAVAEPKVATILYFKEFSEPVKQDWINNLYAKLNPDEDLRKKYSFVSPRDLEQAVKKGEVKTEKRDQMLDDLRKSLGVSNALLISVVSVREGFKVESESLNLQSGETRSHKTAGTFSSEELPLELEKAFHALLKQE